MKKYKGDKTQMLRKILLANAKASGTMVDAPDQYVLNTASDPEKKAPFRRFFFIPINLPTKKHALDVVTLFKA